MKKIRVYADTSVFGGIFDEEFEKHSIIFFEQIKNNQFDLVTSAVVQAETQKAPQKVEDFFIEMLGYAEIIDITDEAIRLRNAYLDSHIVLPKHSNDALHVALATISNCDVVVSWNFKHIVHFEKIPLYNAVNILQGFHQITIYSPMEVIQYE